MTTRFDWDTWMEIANRGTSGDQVMDILYSWLSDREKLESDKDILLEKLNYSQIENCSLRRELDKKIFEDETPLERELANMMDEQVHLQNENAQLRRVLDATTWHWWEGDPELPEEYGRFVCVLCEGEKPDHTKDCPLSHLSRRLACEDEG